MKLSQGIVAHAFNSSIQEEEAGESLNSRPAWSTEPGQQDSQGNTEKPCLRKQTNQDTHKKKIDKQLLSLEEGLFN